jgi:hypothetical protein
VDDTGATPIGQKLYGLYGQARATTAGATAIGVFGLAGTVAAPSGDGVSGLGLRGVVGVGGVGGCGCDGTSNGSTVSYGILGTSDIGVGGTFVGGRCAVLLAPGAGAVANPNTTPPSGAITGDVYAGSTNGSLWYRTNAATNPYRRLADATTAGQLTLLASPVRYIDTRNGTGDPGGAYGNLTVRTYNFVTLMAGTIPAGARGIVGNIVAVSPTSNGNLQLDSTMVFGTAVLNFNNGQDIGNHFVSALTAAGATSIKAAVNGSVHVVIDIQGYYL